MSEHGFTMLACRLAARGRWVVAGNRHETGLLLLAIVAVEVFDRFVGANYGVVFAPGLTAALLLRRPDIASAGLGIFFVSDVLVHIDAAGVVPAMGSTAVVTALMALTLDLIRRRHPDARRTNSARMFIEMQLMAAIAAPLAAAALASGLAEAGAGAFFDLDRLASWPEAVLGIAAILPIGLLGGSGTRGGQMAKSDRLTFLLAAFVVTSVAWIAERSFPYPFIVACLPLLIAAMRLPPLAVAILGAACMIEMSIISSEHIFDRGSGLTFGARVLAAVLTGTLPTGLALLLAELRTERQRLAEAGERLRQVLSGIAGHGFCSLDRNGFITAWNDKIAELKRMSAEEAIGSSFSRFFSPEDRVAGVPDMLIERARSTGRAESIGWRLRGDGTHFWAQTTLEATRDDRGHVVGFVKSVQDQTELQKSQSALLAAERRFGFALGSAGQGVWELDLANRRMEYSPVYAAMLGLTPEALGNDAAAWKVLVHPDDVGLIPPADSDGGNEEVEFRLRHADGHWIWVADRRRVAERDAFGRPTKVMGTHTDVTARKLAEEKFRLAVEASPNGLLIADGAGRIVLVNSEIERMFGYEPGTLMGQSIEDLVPEEFRDRHAVDRKCYAERPSARRMGMGRDLNGRRKDGSLFPVEIGLNPITTSEGIQVLCAVTDITERKIAEEKFRLAVEASPNGVLIADHDGRITLANQEAERMFGWAPGALIGQSIDVLVPEPFRGKHAANRTAYSSQLAARRMGDNRDLHGLRRDGSLFPVEIGFNPIVTAEGESTLCVITDITARKETEAKLALSEERFRTMADHFVDLVVHLDLDFSRTWVSPASLDILGFPPEALLGQAPSNIIHPDDQHELLDAMRAVRTGSGRSSYTARYLHADGHWIWLSVTLRLIRGVDGEAAGVLAVGRDVTRARAAEEALKASLSTFRGAMQGAAIGIALESLDGRWTAVNPALAAIIGCSEEDLVGVDADSVCLPDDVGIDADRRRRLLAGEIESYQVEKRCMHQSGRVVWTLQSISLDHDLDGQVRQLIVLVQDMTERRHIEQMKSEFVSMVSHELRTPLTSIRGALGLVLGAMTNDLPDRAVQLVDIAHKNSERLIPLVNDILDLDKIASGMIRVDLVEADARQLVVQAVEATRAFADRYGVGISLSGIDTPARVRLDEGRFIQVVTNLISNAAKFSPRGKTVAIEVTKTDWRVRIHVTDRGPGIPEDFRSRIFGRFAQADSATTRSKGGSGLGLYICKQLTELMGGTIGFESTLGVGTEFWVEFPLAIDKSKTFAAVAEDIAGAMHPVAILSASRAVIDFLSAAVARVGLAVVAPDVDDPNAAAETGGALVALVDEELATTPVGQAIRARLAGMADAPPVVILGDDGVLVGEWKAIDRWPLQPDRPEEIVRRLAALDPRRAGSLPRILHVEDDTDLAAVLAVGLAAHAEVVNVQRVALALARLDKELFDLAVIDPVLPDGDALRILTPYLERLSIPYLVLSANETVGRGKKALAHLVKSRITEQQLVETIARLLTEQKRPKEQNLANEAMRHAG